MEIADVATVERVRQIEVRAFEKVQSAVKGTIARQEQAALEAAL
jgi:RNA polymerase sigma-32 factor